MKALSVLSKIHKSIVVLLFGLSAAFIFIGVPLTAWDKYVIEEDVKCYNFYHDKSVNNNKCNVHTYEYDGKTSVYSNRTIIDNAPSYRTQFAVAFLLITTAVSLILLKKWLIWVFKD